MRLSNDQSARLVHHKYEISMSWLVLPISKWRAASRRSSLFAKALPEPAFILDASQAKNSSRRIRVGTPTLNGECVSKERPAVILCVDDDPMGLAARRMLLSIAGYEVLSAITGETALQMFRRQKVDLVIADYFLPDSTGTEITAAMKQLKPEVPVVLLTGEMDPPPGSDRADLILIKGMDPPDFLAAIAKILKPPTTKVE